MSFPATSYMPTAPRLALIAIVFGATSSEVLATAQAGDQMRIGSEELWIQTNPLEPYFDANPNARPESEISSTALWRGYVASWEISHGRLLLTDVEILQEKEGSETLDTEFVSVMSSVFPGQPRVVADWYTGYLIAPTGDLVEYVHMGYASTFDRYRIFTVVAGEVTADRAMSAEQFIAFREAQFRAYQRTPEYAAAFEETEKDGGSKAEIESFLFEYAGADYLSRIFDGAERP